MLLQIRANCYEAGALTVEPLLGIEIPDRPVRWDANRSAADIPATHAGVRINVSRRSLAGGDARLRGRDVPIDDPAVGAHTLLELLDVSGKGGARGAAGSPIGKLLRAWPWGRRISLK